MADEGEDNDCLANAWEAGGPNDPRVAFAALNHQLFEVKEELSPFGWRAYATEFQDRQTADKRLRAMAAMPGSGSEPSDGVTPGTPIWQERLDHLLLVEHLKKKIIIANTKFGEASELLLQSHGWLVQNYHLADLFVKFITTVPESSHDRIDYLQAQLEQSRRETINIRQEFEDYIVTLKRKREEWCKRFMDNQREKNKRVLLDDVKLSWSYTTQREQLLTLRMRNDSLEDRCATLEFENNTQAEHLEESQRRWTDEKAALIRDRDDFKKKYNKMVKAHEQAMADLKRTEGTVEGQKQMIIALSGEKAMLENQVAQLEEEARVMQKQLADLRDELAQIREEVRRLLGQLKETEAALVESRLEIERVEGENLKIQDRLDDAAIMEATLKVEAQRCHDEFLKASELASRLANELADEKQARKNLEDLRDELYRQIEQLKADLERTVRECQAEIDRIKAKCRREMDEFRVAELSKVKEDFQKKTDVIVRRNDMLEKEIGVGDALGPHLATLNPLTVDESRVCPVCRKVIVWEGAVRGYPPESGDPAKDA